MCGIVIQASHDTIDINNFIRSLNLIIHRGPDSQAIASLVDDKFHVQSLQSASSITPSNLLLGHARLSILDTSSLGTQPFISKDGRYAIVFNGEIYNYKELRHELGKLGAKFTTNTDTEVLLTCFAYFGASCVDLFNGVWSFGIVDNHTNSLFVSRDRLGVKPLFVFKSNDSISLASEIKALKPLNYSSFSPNADSVSDYLNFGLVDHSDETFFNEISSFPPATIAQYDLNSLKQVSCRKYWNPSDFVDLHQSIVGTPTLNSVSEQFNSLFIDSIKLRLRSDVPLGASLSGGIDSSAIVCAINQYFSKSFSGLTTFTSIPRESSISEENWASLVSNHIRSDHKTVRFDPHSNLDKSLTDLLSFQDQPFTTTSILAQKLIMEKASSCGLKVLLDGQGADEAFCGYRKYIVSNFARLARSGHAVSFLSELIHFLLQGDLSIFDLSDKSRYFRFRPIFKPSIPLCPLPGHLSSSFSSSILSGDIASLQLLDLTSVSLPSLLRYNDHNSMSCGVEARNPFLDYRLVELGLSTPSQLKVFDGQTKAIVRHSLSKILPTPILRRRNKLGFAFTKDSIIRAHLSDCIDSVFSNSSFSRQFVHPRHFARLKQLWLSDCSLPPGPSALLFRMYMLERWSQLNLFA